jgi:hypothetical protein
MKPELGTDGSDLSGFPEVGGLFVAVARNPVLEWRSWGQTVRFCLASRRSHPVRCS